MRVLVAPQEFKGSLTAREAADAIAAGVRRASSEAVVDQAPMADGGPGTLDAVVSARSGNLRITTVRDPLGRPVQARWGLLDTDTAIIEMAEASGLLRLGELERDATVTSTYGVGQLIRAALDQGCRRFVIAVGGSATNDGGAGMAEALGAAFLDNSGSPLNPGGLALQRLATVDLSGFDPRVAESHFEVAVDVRNPLIGPEGASAVYGPQKGASPQQVIDLDGALARFASILARDYAIEVGEIPGGGAAGGLAAGLIAFCGATLRPGAGLVAETVQLYERAHQSDLVLTGEGSLDGQTQYGKAVLEVIKAGAAAGNPVVALAGRVSGDIESLYKVGLSAAFGIARGPTSEAEAVADGKRLLESASEQVIRLITAISARR